MTYIHNLDPFALEFFNGFGIRWYGLAYLAGFVAGYYAILYMAKRRVTALTPDQVGDFITWVAIGTLAGGRLGYCLFYAPDLLMDFTSSFPFWGVLRVNEGGMASHGGILGVMFTCWLYARKNRIPTLHTFDLVVYGGSLGFFFGRIANFINGELYGREVVGHFPWIVKFPQEMHTWGSQSLDKLQSLGPAVETLGHMTAADGTAVPLSAQTWLGWIQNYAVDSGSRSAIFRTIDQLIAATQTGNEAVTQALGLVLTPRYPSQIIQALLEGLLVFIILAWLWRKPQKMGVISGWFGILYSAARILGEQYRMPDAHIGFQLFGLTRGQWLSIALILIAIAYTIRAYMSNSPKMGGWLYGEPLKITKAKKNKGTV